MTRFIRLFALGIALALIGTPRAHAYAHAYAHAQGTTPADTARPQTLRVYLDCQSFYCDFDFFRTEIKFVNWVRDRQVADIHLFVTTQETGAGGTSFGLNFLGQQSVAGMTDSLAYSSRTTDTQDEVRKALARVIKLGLMRYVARTPAADKLEISYSGADTSTSTTKTKDPWNYWVFRANASGNFNGEKTSSRSSGNLSLSASRTTENWKISTSANGNYSESSFTFDSVTSTFYTHSYGSNALVVKSLGPHWFAGANMGFSSSTRQNQKLSTYLGPSVEYDIFPYSQSTRRMLTLRYTLNASAVKYEEETIYDKTKESLLNEQVEASLNVRQPWGSVNTSLSFSHYMHDFSKHSASVFTSLDVRIFKGFSVNLFGSAQSIHDQLFLPKEGASHDDVLLQRRQLETSYSFFAGVGVSYTFGSIFNNVVNPRFGGGGGGMFFMF